jgi:hypothetical protein
MGTILVPPFAHYRLAAPLVQAAYAEGLRLWNPDAIEAQLAHVEGNAVRRACDRAESWDERVKMMQWWADRLDEMKRRDEITHAPK